MYPRNAASPPRIAIGAVMQISDGAVQSSGVSVAVRAEGGSETAGSGTVSYGGSSNIVYYAPTQAETDYVAFVVVAYKTGCAPVAQTIITSASATAGYAGTDQSKIANATSTVNLSGTTIKTATDVETDTQDIQSRLPSALGANGNIKADVRDYNGTAGTFASGRPEVNTTHIAGTAWASTTLFTLASHDPGATIGTSTLTQTQVTGGAYALNSASFAFNSGLDFTTTQKAATLARVTLTDTVTTYTGNTPQTGDAYARLGAPAGASVSADIAAVKTDTGNLVTRITSTLFSGITSLAQWLGIMAGKQTGNSTARTELRATGAGSGTFDETTDSLEAVRDRGDSAWTTATGFSTLDAAGVRSAVGLASANLDTQLDALPTAAENATAVWGAGTRSLTVLDEDSTTLDLDATIRAAVGLSSANLDTQLDALPTAAENADAVWEEAIADHSGMSGSTAEALAAAGAAGDPWITPLPGSYTSGQAGYIIGTNLNATVSSRATQTSVDAIDDYVDTEVAAIKAKTDSLSFDDGNLLVDLRAIASAPVAVDTGTAGTVSFVSGAYVATEGGTVNANVTQIAGENVISDGNGKLLVDVIQYYNSGTDTYEYLPLPDILQDTGTDIPASIDALPTASEINAEVVDALSTDTYAEPGQGNPAATTSIAAKVGYLYKAWRNKSEQDSSEYRLYNDNESTVGQKAAVSDDSSTFTRGEMSTGA